MLHSSLAHTMFALSVEHGTGRALFAGLSSLRLHAVGGKDYAPYGVFVRYAEAENGRQRMEPAENEDVFRYANLLGCARRPGEHGLSVLIPARSEEHTSELQSLMRISYAVFCLKKKNNKQHTDHNKTNII